MNEMFSRSIDQYGVKYTRYIGDGDKATFKGLLNLNPYDVHVKKTRMLLTREIFSVHTGIAP